MPRIRSVHPSQWTDESFVECSFPARLFVIAVRNDADDNGIFEWKPKTLKMKLFPADNIDIEKILEELIQTDHIKKFENDGKLYGVIKNFKKWQKPMKPCYSHTLPDELIAYVGGAESKEATLRKKKWDEQDGKCYYCKSEITFYSKKTNSLEIDHKLPKAKGGTDEEANLAASCRLCNRSKGDKTAEEYIAQLKNNPKNNHRQPNNKLSHSENKAEFSDGVGEGIGIGELNKFNSSERALPDFKDLVFEGEFAKVAAENGLTPEAGAKSFQVWKVTRRPDPPKDPLGDFWIWCMREKDKGGADNHPPDKPLEGRELLIHQVGIFNWRRKEKMSLSPEQQRLIAGWEAKNGAVTWDNWKDYQQQTG